MKKKNLLAVIALSLIICSCSLDKHRLYRHVKSYYKECTNDKKSDCIIDLKEVIKKDWDSVYAIPGGEIVPERIENLINFELAGNASIIFVKKNKVIYQENFRSDVDFFDIFNYNHKTLRFLPNDTILSLDHNHAKFKIQSDDEELFLLRHVE